ncbi:uncharacterized protein THITE_2110949 [Thermothielavioides terrestris NRRL 8126]|uniref:Uncharacterized protein n=1 Tax=Thermothielavioides terrestris (strain ATCC 38088 / NRRL 8126) TaxID=578455 RepID=G2QVG9_THETT|nr:uncharacterized protein THITE_2110949 [Thermothielavioides terrestris NRRL 8126]AEO64659.1 hypothetical protein THITE_2110949 [Thermothielavioides terrestris NRRL 8126]
MAPFPPLPNLTPNLPSPRAILITAAANLDPTKTLPDLLHGLQIHPRQTTSAPGATVTVVSSGPTSSTTDPNETTTLSGGAIAGSVIGSIAGFLLLFWIVRSCTNLGAPPGEVESLPPRRPWYAGVRAEYPDERCPPAGYGKSRGRGKGRGRRRSRSGAAYYREEYGGSRRASVAEVPPVVVRLGRSPRLGYYG